MPTERCSIDKSVTGRAERMARDGYDGIFIFKHMGREGLQLRVQRNTAAWIVRYKDATVTIGYLYPERSEAPLPGHTKALDLAADTRAVLMGDQASRVKEYLRHRHGGMKHHDALAALRPNANTWSLRECVDRMLEDRQAPGADKPLKDTSAKEIRLAFARPQVAHLVARAASLITRGEFEAARDEVRKAAGISAAKKLVANVRSVYGYMARNHSGQSGIDGSDPWWELFHAPYEIKPRTRKPTVEGMVKTLILAEDYLTQPLPGRMTDAPGVGAGVLAGLWWLCLTCQRSGAGLSLRSYDLVPDANREGWYLASWDAGVMKGGSAHLLPIPPRAARQIMRVRERIKVTGANEWAFPSERDPEIHATQSGVYRIIYRLAGRDNPVPTRKDWEPARRSDGSPRKRRERTEQRDLLAEHGIDYWTQHDVRRTLQEVLDAAGIPGGTSVILAHDMKTDLNLAATMDERKREDFLKNRVAKITNAAYGSAQFLQLKGMGMEVWTDAVLDEYERQKALKAQPEAEAA